MRILIACVVSGIALCAVVGLVLAQNPPPAAPLGQAIQLFNGKDLSNWQWVGKKEQNTPNVFTVKDGVIHDDGHPTGYIRTKENYTSYVLKVQWRFIKKGNSGVLLRIQEPDKVWPKGVEAQLNTGDAGDIWLIDNYPAKTDKDRTEGRRTRKMKPSNEKPLGEWNEYEITLDGGNLTLKVNGEVQNTATEVAVMPGHIALQAEGAEIEFKNIELTPIAEK